MPNQPLGADHDGSANAPLGGRTSMPGPASGGYVSYTVNDANTVTALQSQVVVPFAARVQAISLYCSGQTGTATLRVSNGNNPGTSPAILGSTAVTTTATSYTGTSLSNRNIAKDGVLTVDLSGGTNVTNATAVVTLQIRGHVNADSAND